MQTNRQKIKKHLLKSKQMNGQTDRKADTQTCRQIKGYTDRQVMDRQTNRQTEADIKIYRQMHGRTYIQTERQAYR